MQNVRNRRLLNTIHNSLPFATLYVLCICGWIGVFMDADHLFPLYARATHLLCVAVLLFLLGCSCAFAVRYIYKLVLK